MRFYSDKTKDELYSIIESEIAYAASSQVNNIRNGSLDNLSSNIEFLVTCAAQAGFKAFLDNIKDESEIDDVLLGKNDVFND